MTKQCSSCGGFCAGFCQRQNFTNEFTPMIKTWGERCVEHPDHQTGMVSYTMIQARMQEEIDALRAALAQPEQEPYPLPESLYPDSKDWVASDHAGRVEWLHFMYCSKAREVEQLETTRLRAALAQHERKPPKHKSAIATVFHEEDGRQQIEFITQVPVGELVRLYADPPLYHMDLMNVAVAVRDACHRAWVTSMENWRGDIDLTEIVTNAANHQPIDDKVLWEMWVESPSDVLRFARAIEKAHGIE